MSKTATHTTSPRDRSYKVRETIPTGSRVRLTVEATSYVPVPAGTVGTVQTYSNAGFGGIEASLLLDVVPAGRVERLAELAETDSFYKNVNPRRISVSAGLLEAI